MLTFTWHAVCVSIRASLLLCGEGCRIAVLYLSCLTLTQTAQVFLECDKFGGSLERLMYIMGVENEVASKASGQRVRAMAGVPAG